MPAYVALLRGINVGGARKVAMSDLRTMLTEAGYGDVGTYIQSGNAVFTSTRRSPKAIEADIEQRLLDVVGFEVDTVVRSADQLDAIVDANPFTSEARSDGTKVAVAFLKRPISAAAKRELASRDFSPESVVAVTDRDLTIHYPNGQGRSKLDLRFVAQPATARNWKTVLKLQELLAALR